MSEGKRMQTVRGFRFFSAHPPSNSYL